MRLWLKFNPDTYDDEVIMNNYLETGFILNVNFQPYEFMILNPIVVTPYTHVWIGLENQLTRVNKVKYPVFPKYCKDEVILQISRGE